MPKKAAGFALVLILGMTLLLSGVASAGFEDNYQKGRILYLKKKYKEAAQTFSRLASDYPRHSLRPDAIYWLGECYYARGKYREAVVEFERAATLAPNSPRAPDALLKRAYILSRLGEYEAAVSVFKDILARYPGAPAAGRAEENLNLLNQDRRKETAEPPEVKAARAVLGENALKAAQAEKTSKTKTSGKANRQRVQASAGMSDIMGAIKRGDLASFKTILTKFPYVVEFRNKEGKTPLHMAAAYNRLGMAKMLLANEADVNADSGSYIFVYTPLHEAARYNSLEAAKLLIANGAKINAGKYIRRKEWADRYSFTPLHQAVRYDHIEMVRLLLDNGADPNISAHPAVGETPLRMAREKGYRDIAKVLKAHLAIH